MGTDNFVWKKREARRKTKIKSIEQRPNHWLIVTEGSKTEPIYFKLIIDILNQHLPDDRKLTCKISGEGKNTTSLVETAEEMLSIIDKETKQRIIPYEKKFVVFDKDDFVGDQFNSAIEKCRKIGCIPLWSNEAIEYWFLLHFNYYDCSISRKEYKEKIEKELRKRKILLKYYKNNEEVIKAIIMVGSLKMARRNAKKVFLKHKQEKNTPAKANSCTKIFEFFDEIDKRNKELSLPRCEEIFDVELKKEG